jgi:hypothetical protein
VGLVITSFFMGFFLSDVGNLINGSHFKNQAGKQSAALSVVKNPSYVGNNDKSDGKQQPSRNQYADNTRHKIYPYSVVSGGTHSVQALRSAIWHDPVIAKHYSNFKIEKATIVEAQMPMTFYVSYRVGDKIYWTKKKLQIAKGEKLITDGQNLSRTRCANRLSEVPQAQTLAEEPTPEILNLPVEPPPELVPEEKESSTDNKYIAAEDLPSLEFHPVKDSRTYKSYAYKESHGHDDVHSVPEPNMMILLTLGLIGLAGIKKKFKK